MRTLAPLAPAMFTIHAQEGLARCGTLLARHSTVCTPAPLIYTRRGGCLYLTPDMLERLKPEAQMLQVNAMQFLAQPNAAALQQYGQSLHHYIGMPGWPMLVSNRDASLAEYSGLKPSTNTACYVHTHSGGMQVTPEKYMASILAMQPELYVSMADEVSADASAKRTTSSVDRTLLWLDECMRLHQQHYSEPPAQAQAQQHQRQQPGADESAAGGEAAAICQQQQEQQQQERQEQHQQQQVQHACSEAAAEAGADGGVSLSGRRTPSILAPVVGGRCAKERARSAEAAAARPVAGFALCGFGTGELPEERPQLLAAAIRHLPADKPRFITGLAAPEEVLEAISQGVDFFDCSYPLHATANGYVLKFPFVPGAASTDRTDGASKGRAARSADETGVGVDAEAGADDSKLNMWSLQYRLDKRPLVEGCSCFACRNHTRAYVHHLLHTHEMLGSVLLELHNTHWWLAFFAAVRAAISDGRLEEYRAWFTQRRQLAMGQAA